MEACKQYSNAQNPAELTGVRQKQVQKPVPTQAS